MNLTSGMSWQDAWVKRSPHDSSIAPEGPALQASLVVTRCGTRHVKRIGRVSLGTGERLHRASVSVLCPFRISLTLPNGVGGRI